MKKIIVFIIAASALLAACTTGPGYSAEYYENVSFEYSYDYKDYPELFGEDSTYFDVKGGIGIGWGDLGFFHKVENNEFKGGFILSYLKPAGDGTKERPQDYVVSPYRAMGSFYPTNRTYSIYINNKDNAMMPEHDFKFYSVKYGTCTMSHCWVNNTEEVFDAVKKNFKPGDELRLKAIGYLNGAQTGTAEIKMAADTAIYNWTKFNLAPLGSVEDIDFEVTCTNSNVPLNFCLDELVAKIKVEY